MQAKLSCLTPQLKPPCVAERIAFVSVWSENSMHMDLFYEDVGALGM